MLALLSVAHGEPTGRGRAAARRCSCSTRSTPGSAATPRARSGSICARSPRGRQVLCITHLPQVAALAERHFTIAKDAGGGAGAYHRHRARRRRGRRRAGADARRGRGRPGRRHARKLLSGRRRLRGAAPVLRGLRTPRGGRARRVCENAGRRLRAGTHEACNRAGEMDARAARSRRARRLRRAVAALPLDARQAMLDALAEGEVIVGAYTDRRGRTCAMLALRTAAERGSTSRDFPALGHVRPRPAPPRRDAPRARAPQGAASGVAAGADPPRSKPPLVPRSAPTE